MKCVAHKRAWNYPGAFALRRCSLMCAVRISLLPVSSCSCSQEEIRSLGIAEPVSLKIISATVLALLGCSTEPRYSGFHAQCIRSRFRADDGRTRCKAAGIYKSFGTIKRENPVRNGRVFTGRRKHRRKKQR